LAVQQGYLGSWLRPFASHGAPPRDLRVETFVADPPTAMAGPSFDVPRPQKMIEKARKVRQCGAPCCCWFGLLARALCLIEAAGNPQAGKCPVCVLHRAARTSVTVCTVQGKKSGKGSHKKHKKKKKKKKKKHKRSSSSSSSSGGNADAISLMSDLSAVADGGERAAGRRAPLRSQSEELLAQDSERRRRTLPGGGDQPPAERRGGRGHGADRYRLFVGGLAWTTTEPALAAAFGRFGELLEVRVIMEREDPTRSRGYVRSICRPPPTCCAAWLPGD
jgi:hypothetical protein